jgi:hypothetical protein
MSHHANILFATVGKGFQRKAVFTIPPFANFQRFVPLLRPVDAETDGTLTCGIYL